MTPCTAYLDSRGQPGRAPAHSPQDAQAHLPAGREPAEPEPLLALDVCQDKGKVLSDLISRHSRTQQQERTSSRAPDVGQSKGTRLCGQLGLRARTRLCNAAVTARGRAQGSAVRPLRHLGHAADPSWGHRRLPHPFLCLKHSEIASGLKKRGGRACWGLHDASLPSWHF